MEGITAKAWNPEKVRAPRTPLTDSPETKIFSLADFASNIHLDHPTDLHRIFPTTGRRVIIAFLDHGLVVGGESCPNNVTTTTTRCFFITRPQEEKLHDRPSHPSRCSHNIIWLGGMHKEGYKDDSITPNYK